VAEVSGEPGGFLLIPHGPGLVVAWMAGLLEPASTPAGVADAAAMPTPATPGEGGAGSWQAPLADRAQALTPPATVPLDGRFAHLTISVRQPAVLHVRAVTPALTLLRRAAAGDATAPASGAAATESVQIHPAGVSLDAYLVAGTSDLGFSALGETPLGGFAEITTTPVQPADEGLGPEVLLPAGETRYFSFHVASRRPVGWGAAAGSERVGCTLLRGDGRPVTPRPLATGRTAALAGLIDMAELDAGDYLLALAAPPDAAPVRARPVLVGLRLPDTGPPPEVIRQYLQEAGAVAAAAPGSQP
jgi:hypothetical protein